MKKILFHGNRDGGYLLLSSVFMLMILVTVLLAGLYVTDYQLQTVERQIEEVQ